MFRKRRLRHREKSPDVSTCGVFSTELAGLFRIHLPNP